MAYLLLCIEWLWSIEVFIYCNRFIQITHNKSPQNSVAWNHNHLFAKILWTDNLGRAHLSLWFWLVSLMCLWPFGRSTGEQLVPNGLTHMSSSWLGLLDGAPWFPSTWSLPMPSSAFLTWQLNSKRVELQASCLSRPQPGSHQCQSHLLLLLKETHKASLDSR